MSDADASGDSDSVVNELQNYALVRFIHKGRKKKIESIDIVPTKWLDINKKRNQMITKFLAEPYESEDIKMLHYLVKRNVSAPQDWPTFPVAVLGRASKNFNFKNCNYM